MKCVVNFIHKLRPLLKGHIQNPLKKEPSLSLSLSFSLFLSVIIYNKDPKAAR